MCKSLNASNKLPLHLKIPVSLFIVNTNRRWPKHKYVKKMVKSCRPCLHLCTIITSGAIVPHSLVSDTTDLIKDCYFKLRYIIPDLVMV